MREQTEAMRLPRFLWVPFPLGRPFGAPDEPGFQRRVLHDALALLERDDGPVVLADFPDDAPVADEEVPWSCPISYTQRASGEPVLVEDTLTEIRSLAPWVEPGTEPRFNTDMRPAEIARFLGHLSVGEDVGDPPGGQPLVEVTRLACDDLRTWYLTAVRRQPGHATTPAIDTWFWRQTALGRLLGALAARLLDDPDPKMRLFAERALIPRDHMTALIPPHPDHRDSDD